MVQLCAGRIPGVGLRRSRNKLPVPGLVREHACGVYPVEHTMLWLHCDRLSITPGASEQQRGVVRSSMVQFSSGAVPGGGLHRRPELRLSGVVLPDAWKRLEYTMLRVCGKCPTIYHCQATPGRQHHHIQHEYC